MPKAKRMTARSVPFVVSYVLRVLLIFFSMPK
jgi:hypothetical protein